MLVSLIGIFIVKRRRYLRNQYDLQPKGGIANTSDTASIVTQSLSSSSSESNNNTYGNKRSEWKTFWSFKKQNSTSSDKPFAKQDYEVK